MRELTRNSTYAEWKATIYEETYDYLRVFPKEEVTAFLESEEEHIKKRYEKAKESEVFTTSGIAYGFSLMF